MGKLVFGITLCVMLIIAVFRTILNTPWDWPILIGLILAGAYLIPDIYVKQTYVIMVKTRRGMREYASWWGK